METPALRHPQAGIAGALPADLPYRLQQNNNIFTKIKAI
jgi:hypothetical protein